MRAVLFGICLLTLCFFSAAQQSIRFERIGIREGLSYQGVGSIFQDSRGFIWFGTAFGLNRFDGISCKTWYHNDTNSNSLVSNKILSITEDSLHYLWIGTQEGVSQFDPVTEKFNNYFSGGKGDFLFPKENCYTYVDKNNTVWVGSNRGVSWLDRASGQFKDLPVELTRPGTFRNVYASSMLHDSKGRLWLSTSYGIKKINADKKTIVSYHMPESGVDRLGSNACTVIAEDRKGRIFAGTWNDGVQLFDESSQKFLPFVLSRTGYFSGVSSILPFVENNMDYMWVGTFNGLFKIKTVDVIRDPDNFPIVEFLPDKTNPESISSDVINCIIPDRSSNLWIGTSVGVNKIDPLEQQFQTIHFSIGKGVFPFINGMVENIHTPGELFFSTPGKIFTWYPGSGARPVASPLKQTTAIIHDKQFYWIGSFEGLWQCGAGMKPVKQWLTFAFNTRLEHGKVKSILADKNGNIWCGLWRGGILKIDPQKGTIEKFLADSSAVYNLSRYIITRIIEDRRSNLWFACNNGLYQFRAMEKKFYRYRMNNNAGDAEVDAIECLKETKDGRIWIGSRQGLRYYDYASDKMIPVNFKKESINNYINGIIEDDSRILWLATANGLLQFNPENGEIKQFTTANGLPQNDLSELFEKGPDGRIYIGSRGIVSFFDPASMVKNKLTYPPVFTGIMVDNKTIPFSDSPARIKYNQSITVDFVALNFSNPAGNQYAYQLAGIDKEWKPIGNNRTLRFSNLSSGHYELKIKAANSDAVWNGKVATYSFTVLPPFWKTWWFMGLIAIVIAASLYAFYRYRLQRALEMERMRTRIATDLHDDIGATLSSISMYSEAVKEQIKEKLPQLQPVLDKMGENSRSMVSSMSDIVWAINPDNDEGQRLLHRMESYAKDTCAVKNVSLNFSADEKINTIKLSLEHRKNIYLLFKESLNNALKYAEADRIDVTLKLQDKKLFLNIFDNGKGFDLNKIKKGNGLKNMETRAAEIAGTVKIESVEEKGTRVCLECSIA